MAETIAACAPVSSAPPKPSPTADQAFACSPPRHRATAAAATDAVHSAAGKPTAAANDIDPSARLPFQCVATGSGNRLRATHGSPTSNASTPRASAPDAITPIARAATPLWASLCPPPRPSSCESFFTPAP